MNSNDRGQVILFQTEDGELCKDTTCAKFACVVNRGIRGMIDDVIDFYNLDMIISVGYRVHSHCGTQFRKTSSISLRLNRND